jgi:hypothetical protein
MRHNETAYPEPLASNEHELLLQRPRYSIRGAPKPVGFGLSGGGIRSATFCLGVFQALANLGLLINIDYVSSVSGGSYFASFYGRLFTRSDVDRIGQVAQILTSNESEPADGGANHWMRKVFRWLRENGRYLSPHGAGDLLLDLAVVLRNLVSLQIIMALFILIAMLLLQFIRALFQRFARGEVWHTYYQIFYRTLPFRSAVWWSPYTLLAFALLVLTALPAGWAYWLLSNQREGETSGWGFFKLRLWIPPVAILAGSVWLAWSKELCLGEFALTVIAGLVSLTTLALALFYTWRALRETHRHPADKCSGQLNLGPSDIAGNLLSSLLKLALVAGFSVLGFSLIDTFGQTAYAGGLNWKWLVPLVGPLALAASLAPFIQWIVANLGAKLGNKAVSIPVGLIAGVGAAMLIIPIVILLDCLSHAIAYERHTPVSPPELLRGGWAQRRSTIEITSAGWHLSLLCPEPASLANPQSGLRDLGADLLAKPGPAVNQIRAVPSKQKPKCDITGFSQDSIIPSRMQWGPIAIALVIVLVLSLIVGRSPHFLNGSSLNALYRDRLVRAYLGASNANRYQGLGRPVTQVVPGDDIAQEEYWNAAGDRQYGSGAPIHLLNVTINETYDGRTELEQHDRKGLGMAVGPAGISAGVKHHVAFNRNSCGVAEYKRWRTIVTRPAQYEGVQINPLQNAGRGPQAQEFRVFEYGSEKIYDGQLLALGSWTAISGAAVSTGLGFRTSLALSLLAGIFNVRLGYWWDSRVVPKTPRTARGKVGRLLNLLFPVQRALLSEFLSRFPGTSENYWYLSDGGHFENLGGYELIRRELPLIVIIDAEADSDYGYEGLGNLAQKARLDFGAEIEFLNQARLDKLLVGPYSALRPYFGSLEQLRRGRWAEEPVNEPETNHKRLSLAPADSERLSLAHAALAQVRYGAAILAGEAQSKGWLILIKPTLTGDEPADVLRYHNRHPAFPHETTADQWFNESQWESYRKLGEHIGIKLFQAFERGDFPDFDAVPPVEPRPDNQEAAVM